MSAMPVDPLPQQVHCLVGHILHRRNTALDMDGTIICLDCVALVHEAPGRIAGRLIAVTLNLAPMPSRMEVGA